MDHRPTDLTTEAAVLRARLEAGEPVTLSVASTFDIKCPETTRARMRRRVHSELLARVQELGVYFEAVFTTEEALVRTGKEPDALRVAQYAEKPHLIRYTVEVEALLRDPEEAC